MSRDAMRPGAGIENGTGDSQKETLSERLGKIEPEVAFESLSEDIREELFMDFEPAAGIEVYDSMEEFMSATNNFQLHFAGGLAEYYRTTNHYVRFESLFPELAEKLKGHFHVHSNQDRLFEQRNQPFDRLPREDQDIWQMLFSAYHKMAALVSEKDSFFTESAGEYRRRFLHR